MKLNDMYIRTQKRSYKFGPIGLVAAVPKLSDFLNMAHCEVLLSIFFYRGNIANLYILLELQFLPMYLC